MKHHCYFSTIALSIIISLSSCTQIDDKPDGACGAGYGNYDFSHVSPFPANTLFLSTGTLPPEGKVGYFYADSLITFLIGKNYNYICSKEHTSINFTATFGGTVPHTIPIKIFGEAYYGFAKRSVTVFEGMPQLGAELPKTPLEIGLEQQFKDKKADIDFYLKVSFKTLGSFSQDSLYFAQHIASLRADGRYSIHN